MAEESEASDTTIGAWATGDDFLGLKLAEVGLDTLLLLLTTMAERRSVEWNVRIMSGGEWVTEDEAGVSAWLAGASNRGDQSWGSSKGPLYCKI